MYLLEKNKKIMRVIAKPIIKYLYKNNKTPVDFIKSTMIVRLLERLLNPSYKT